MYGIKITPINASFVRVTSEHEGIVEDLYQYLRFDDPQFTPNRFSRWDGQVRLYDKKKGTVGYGLLSTIVELAKVRGWEVDIDPAFKQDYKPIKRDEIETWASELNVSSGGKRIDPYDYQIDAVYHAFRQSRITELAATSAGKSLIQYMIIRFFQQMTDGVGRVLLVVPSINLVSQMYNDFKDYSTMNGWDVESHCHMICEGATPYTDKPIHISTWQSLKDLPPEFFEQFELLIGDECHLFSGECLKKIGESCINAYNRVGLTGTLKKDKLHPLQVQQHFGSIKRIVTTKELQDAGRASKTSITMYQCEYEPADRQLVYEENDYAKEIEFLIGHKKRNKLIKTLAQTLKGNTLMLFDRVEKHMEIIHAELCALNHQTKKFFLISGEVSNSERNDIKAATESGMDIVILGSYGCVSTGISIKKLHNLVLCHPTRSIIRTLQSIGRMLRLHDTKDVAYIYDIVDILLYSGKLNHSMKHASERVGFYRDEGHPITVKKIHFSDVATQ